MFFLVNNHTFFKEKYLARFQALGNFQGVNISLRLIFSTKTDTIKIFKLLKQVKKLNYAQTLRIIPDQPN